MSSLTEDQRALLSLSLVSGVGPRLTSSLLERFGSALAAVRATPDQLSAVPHISTKLARQFRDALDTADIDAEIERMARHDVQLVFRNTQAYPAPLENISVPPLFLYVRGTLDSRDERAIGIVGSRHCTTYGKRFAERLGADLARAGWTVVSGLARGIDGCAHRGALHAGGRTIAVMAGGLSSIYPPEHKDLAEQVSESGALITEYNMRMEPLPVLFPMRNRIISGLSRGIVIVEANKKSGALITAEHAAEQGREVFAVPGQVDSTTSAGTLQLIRNGAKMVRGADDILEDLHGVAAPTRRNDSTIEDSPVNREPPPDLNENQRRVWDFLNDGSHHQDEMVQELGIPVSELSGMLLMLEMKKAIRRLPGNRYERC